MYDGFEKEDLRDWNKIVKPIEHLGRIYWATARARQKDDTLGKPVHPFYHPGIAHEVLLRLQKDLLHNSTEPNEFKQAGYLTFWIRKLKPFRHYPIFGGTQTNEYLALHFGLATVSSQHPGVYSKATKSRRLWEEWLYDLRFRAVSGHTISKQFEMLAL